MVAAFRSDLGASRHLLLATWDRRIVTLVSVPLMLEYEALLRNGGYYPAGTRMGNRDS